MKFIHPSEFDRRFWLTPPDIYSKLDAEFGFDFDPCPYPRPEVLQFSRYRMGPSLLVDGEPTNSPSPITSFILRP
jgi:hypothetical protein